MSSRKYFYQLKCNYFDLGDLQMMQNLLNFKNATVRYVCIAIYLCVSVQKL